MRKVLLKEWQSKVALAFFVLYSFLWIYLQYSRATDTAEFHFFGITYCLVAFWGAIWGISIASKWGGTKSVMGKALVFFSLGLFAQTFGQIAYSLYAIVLKIDVPYPSIGDLGFFGSIPLYIVGMLYLAQASGVSISLRSFKNKIQVVVLPLLLLFFSYLIFLRKYEFNWSNPLVVFLDFGYPLGQSIYISIALLTFSLSKGLLGGKMKIRILLVLFALVLQYLSDFVFLYQASNKEWSVAGLNDYMYFVSYFVMALSLIQFKTVYNELRQRPE